MSASLMLPPTPERDVALGAVLVLDQQRQLTALERDWKQLSATAEFASPFLSWEWQQSWLHAATDNVTPLIVAAPFPDGTLAGVLALQRRRRRGLRQLEFLGQDSGADDLDCLLHPQAPPGTAWRLLSVGLRRSGWDVLRLEGANRTGRLAMALRENRACSGPFRSEPGEWLPYLDLPSSYEQYLATRSGNFRSEVRRRRRGFWRRYPAARLECAEGASAITDAFNHLFRLHNLRQAQRGNVGIFDVDALRRFHLSAGVRLAARGQARLYLLRANGAPVAALYGLSDRRRFFYFQSGFDPALADLSPGVTIMSLVIEDCIRRGEIRFEFLRGDEGYKSRWTDQRRRSENWLGAGSPAGAVFLRLRAWRQQWHTGGGQ